MNDLPIPAAVTKLVDALTDEQLAMFRAALCSRTLTRSMLIDLNILEKERRGDDERVQAKVVCVLA